MTEKEYYIKQGDNNLYNIYYHDRYILTMRYKSEAEEVVYHFNLNQMVIEALDNENTELTDLIKSLRYENLDLRTLLRKNGIYLEECEEND